ncbi:MAG: DNA-binding domain-containing protein [Gammaproteobacteria bacterium]|nr:DNA-binding domain-containing protein [Gammaproteobacteria bacterium]
MTLKQLQKNFQSAILENNSRILKSISTSKNLSESQQIQIYQNAYCERIVGAMKQDFPVLCASIGESAFSSLVCDYLKTHPSQNYNLRYIGENLAEFILLRDASLEAYADLAKLEWLFCESEIDLKEREFQTQFNVVAVWQEFQDGKMIDLQLLPEKIVLQIKAPIFTNNMN